jgi:hypothetical protein
MKNKLLLIAILLGNTILYSQVNCTDCPEDKGISTNHANPENCEVEEQYPSKTNQFLNTFDWAKNSNNAFHSIPLNTLAGWSISAPANMESPFYQGYMSKPGGTPINDFDFHWEDGWELMYMNTGYYPNGDVYHDHNLNNNPIINYSLGLRHQAVPYIILYNRYTGKMRSLFNVFSDLGTFTDIKLNVGYISTSAVSGIFRHGNGYDAPMDQKTSTPSYSTNFLNGNNNQKWFMSDVQLGYDPCVCDYFSKFDFHLYGITTYDVNIEGRSIAAQVPLKDPTTGKPTYTDYLNMNTFGTDLNSTGSGALIYKSLDGMLTDYDKELKEYKDRLEDYNSIGNKAMRSLMGLAKTGLNAGLTGLVPNYVLKDLSSSSVMVVTKLTDRDEYDKAKQWYQTDPNDPNSQWLISDVSSKPEGEEAYKRMQEDAKKYSMGLSKALKGGVGSMSDALFTSFYTEPTKPVAPNMPTATLSEMRIQGTIGKSSLLDVGTLYNPGSFKFGGSFNASEYPIYNEPVGLFALLKTPELMVYDAEQEFYMESNGNQFTLDSLYIKLKSPLKYRFNRAVDIDLNKTRLYAQIQVETYKISTSEDRTKPLNLKLLHSLPYTISIPNATIRNVTYSSDWYPIEMLGEQLFGIAYNAKTIIGMPFYDLTIKKITLKIMADMYFQSQGFGGTEKNTTQVFTYLLYEKDGVNFIQEKGEYVSSRKIIAKYHPGNLILENEVIEPTDAFVHEVIGNTIYVNATSIELKGNISVATGYNADLKAYWDIKSAPTTQISPTISLSIKKDFYNFPATNEVTNSELEAFCKTPSTKEYQANVLTKKMKEKPINSQKEKSKGFNANVYPNPNNGTFNVTVYDEIDSDVNLVLTDITGKQILTKQIPAGQNTTQIETHNLANGVYMLIIKTTDKQTTQKVIINNP